MQDNCKKYKKEVLDKIQYETSRIDTGLTKSVSLHNLLKEIGWVDLAEKRRIRS